MKSSYNTFINNIFRCGKLTYHIPYPLSLLNRRDFQLALWDTYFGNPCNCDPSSSESNSDTAQTQQGHGSHDRSPHHSRTSNSGPHHHTQHHHHHHSHHHDHQRASRLRRSVRDTRRENEGHEHSHGARNDLRITLHRNRMAEILSNRISKCRFEDTLCHILYSNGIRYRRRHARLANRLLQNQ